MSQRSPLSRSAVEDLPPIEGAPRRARDVVTDACLRWDLARLVPSATLSISELVSNVVEPRLHDHGRPGVFSSNGGYVADEYGKTVWATLAVDICSTDDAGY